MMTHGSLFSGIGGFDLGFARAGIKTIWQVEIDEYCRRVLEQHFPDARRCADIRTFAVADSADRGLRQGETSEIQARPPEESSDAGELSRRPKRPCGLSVDIISGGFPCQPVSHAGKRQGSSDSRYLWPEMFRVIRTLRPSWVVAENVYGLITHDDGALLDEVYDDLEGEGYETLPPIVLPACAFGAPHRRDRVWIVAHRPGTRCDGPAREEQHLQRQSLLSARSGDGGDVAHSEHSNGRSKCEDHSDSHGRHGLGWSSETVGDSARGRLEEQRGNRSTAGSPRAEPVLTDRWAVEPDVGRVAHGIPKRVDRLKGLGNAIIPQIAEMIGRVIVNAS